MTAGRHLGLGTHTLVLPTVDPTQLAPEALAAAHRGVLRAPEFVGDHFHEKFPANHIAEYCGLSRFQFSRSFHTVFGITFREYLLRYRILEACARLDRGEQAVTEIAIAVGFHDGSYFARMFRRYTGHLPSQYARRHDRRTD